MEDEPWAGERGKGVVGCLLFLVVFITGGVTSYFLLNDFSFGLVVSGVAAAALTILLEGVGDLRTAAVLWQWATERRCTITDFHFRAGRTTPPEMPWWRDWAAYEMTATNEEGTSVQYYFFITGYFFCCFGHRLTVSTPRDYINIHPFDGRFLGLSDDEMSELIERKSKTRGSGPFEEAIGKSLRSEPLAGVRGLLGGARRPASELHPEVSSDVGPVGMGERSRWTNTRSW